MSAGLHLRASMPLREFSVDVDLEVEATDRLAIVGPSGAGKSSLLRMAAGLLSPRSGCISHAGETWFDSAAAIDLAPERRRCGFVFQDFALFPHMSAWRNVAYGMRGVARGQRRGRSLDLLGRFGISALAEARPGQMSGGERQRVALARALAVGPRVLLLDEPLAALDPTTRRRSLGELHAFLKDLEIPVLIVTHSFDEAALLGDKIAVLDRGLVVQSGTAAELSNEPTSAFVADFAGAVVLRGVVRKEPDGLTSVELDGGGTVRSIESAQGPVAVCIFPWEISLERLGATKADSVLNRVEGKIASMTTVGNRIRVGLLVPQPLGLEITAHSARAMGLAPGDRVIAAWKATATRLIPLNEDARLEAR